MAAYVQAVNSALSGTSASLAEYVHMWPVIAGWKWFYGPQSALHIDCNGQLNSSSSFAEKGDVLTATLLNAPSVFSERFKPYFVYSDDQSEYQTVRGNIVHTWTVHHPKRRGDPSFQEESSYTLDQRDEKIYAAFTNHK